MANNISLGIHCVVPECSSTLRKVNQWKARPCPKHKGKTQSQCMCPEPYLFFKFPTEIKLQKLWLGRVRRPDLEINNLTRVCSLHFVEGRPTRRNYFPSVNLQRSYGEEIPGKCHSEDGDVNKQKRQTGDHQPLLPKIPRLTRADDTPTVPVTLAEGDDQEVNEGDLTISRFNYCRRKEDNVKVYETVPTRTNTVTITRVTSAKSSSTGMATNRIDKRLTGTSTDNTRSTPAPLPSQTIIQQGQAPLHRVNPSSSKLKRTVEVSEENNDFEIPYEIAMVEDDDGDGDCSELSYTDVGNESKQNLNLVHETVVVGKRYPVASPGAVFISEAQTRQSNKTPVPVAIQNTVPTRAIIVRPKTIPMLAVAPKTHQVIQPLTRITRLDQETGQIIQRAVPIQPKQEVTHTSVITYTNAVTSQATPKPSTSTLQVQQNIEASKPLATYDPSRQQLQIANPVKYIQECHARIADLLAENEKLKSKNISLEMEVQELKRTNSDLQNEIAQHEARRNQQVPVSIIVPKQEPPEIDNIVASNNASRSRIRYRYANLISRPM